MADKEFTEREEHEFSGFGELPEDLRGMGPVSLPDGSFIPGIEGDIYGNIYGGGATARTFVEPIPGSYTNQAFSFSAINYLPRANFESFRSQRFFAFGAANIPAAGPAGAFVDLLVDVAALPPGSPQTGSSGLLVVPQGFAAVITGLRQWVGDANAFQKTDGTTDDVSWRVVVNGAPAFSFGNFPCVISSLDNEAKMFIIATESTTIQLSAQNSIDPSDPLARSIPVKGGLTGHWFPVDELDDIFRNK